MQRKLMVTTVEELPALGERETLTFRELQVLALACRMTNKEIARKLQISDQTVKNHITMIQKKLHTGTRTESVVQAIGMGLLRVEVQIAKQFGGTLTG